jgi:hypothetical protein
VLAAPVAHDASGDDAPLAVTTFEAVEVAPGEHLQAPVDAVVTVGVDGEHVALAAGVILVVELEVHVRDQVGTGAGSVALGRRQPVRQLPAAAGEPAVLIGRIGMERAADERRVGAVDTPALAREDLADLEGRPPRTAPSADPPVGKVVRDQPATVDVHNWRSSSYVTPGLVARASRPHARITGGSGPAKWCARRAPAGRRGR